MKATEITQTVVVRFELEPDVDMENEATKREATHMSRWVLAAEIEGFYASSEWIETRFMPMGFVEVEYRTVIGLDKE